MRTSVDATIVGADSLLLFPSPLRSKNTPKPWMQLTPVNFIAHPKLSHPE
jgi:hypothetical protein